MQNSKKKLFSAAENSIYQFYNIVSEKPLYTSDYIENTPKTTEICLIYQACL